VGFKRGVMNKEESENFRQMLEWCLKQKIDVSFRNESNTPLLDRNDRIVLTFTHYRKDGTRHESSHAVNRFEELFDHYFEHRMKQVAADLIIEPLRIK